MSPQTQIPEADALHVPSTHSYRPQHLRRPGLKLAGYTLLVLGLILGFRLVRSESQAQASSTWAAETDLPVALQEVSVVALNGQIYLTGGDSNQGRSQALYLYDPASRTWSARAPYPGIARDHIGTAAADGTLYLIGGLIDWPGPLVATVQRYDPDSDIWAEVAPLPLPRRAMGVAAIDGKIYTAGGLREGQAVDDFAVYDPTAGSWQSLPPLSTARDHLVGVALGGKFYAIGGRPGSDAICAPMTTVEVFDTATNSWSAAAAMSTARGGHAAGTLNGKIQVFGGEGSAGSCGIIGSAEEYDPASNSWSPLPSMPTPRHGLNGATIGNSIYLPGGGTATGSAPTAVHERFDQFSSGYMLTASPNVVAPGDALTVSWTAPPEGSSSDWIGLYKVGDSNNGYLWWQYTGGRRRGA